MIILNGYIYNYTGDLDISKELYKQTLKKSILCENESYKHASLSNIGKIEVDKNINNFLEKIVFDYNDNLLKIKNKNKFNN